MVKTKSDTKFYHVNSSNIIFKQMTTREEFEYLEIDDILYWDIPYA